MSFFKILGDLGNSIGDNSNAEIKNENNKTNINEQQQNILEREFNYLNLNYTKLLHEFLELKKSIETMREENVQLKNEIDNLKKHDENIKNLSEDNKILNLKNNEFESEMTKTKTEYLKLKKISMIGLLVFMGLSTWVVNKNAKLETQINSITSMNNEEKVSLEEFKNLQNEMKDLMTKNSENSSLENDKLALLEKEISELKNTDNDINRKIKVIENKNIITKATPKNTQNINKRNNQSSKSNNNIRYTQDDIYTRLLELGYRGNNAIANFQMRNGLNPTGIADRETIFRMGL